MGADSDTRFFKLRRKQSDLDLPYHELDFDANIRSKIARLRSPQFTSTAKFLRQTDLPPSEFEVSDEDSRLTSYAYHIHPQDLRQLAKGKSALTGIDTALPTFFVWECCLIYLTPDHADAVLQYFTSLFSQSTPLAIVVYEPIRPNDSFGRTMASNVTARSIQLQILEKYADLREQRETVKAERV